jgi:hypothetical protein
VLERGTLEGGCAFVVPREESAALSWDEEVIVVRGSAKWRACVTSCCCLVILGGLCQGSHQSTGGNP